MSRILISAALLTAAIAAPLAAQNTTLLQNWKRTNTSANHSDVWGYTAPDGKEFGIIGETAGISILDTTDPRNIKSLGFFPHFASSYAWRDYTNIGKYIYAVSELHRGIWVFEIQANGLPKDHGMVQTATISSAHNIRSDPATGLLYVVGGNNRGMAIFDTKTNPTNPSFIAVWNQNYVHDACIRRGKAYVCVGSPGLTRILDIRNPTNIPGQIGQCDTQSGYNHSCWISEDDKILCICDEIGRGAVTPHMTVWDVSNPALPVKRGDFDPGNGAIAHNVFVIGRTAFLSYYINGFYMVDLVDPTRPTSLANYKSSNRTGTGYFGTWGCFPFADSGTVYLSDMQEGFFAVQVDCGHMNRFGAGTAGGNGVPRARFDGATPKVGAGALRVEVENLEPNRSFWVALSGSAAAPTTVLGATVHVNLATGGIIGPFVAGGDGKATIPAAVPNDPGLGNAKFYLQVFSDRGNGSLSASRGMWAGICK